MAGKRIDTVSGAVAVASAMRRIEPPADVLLIKGAEPHFHRIIAARPAVTAWNDEAVAFAAAYANHMAATFRYQAVLDNLKDDQLVSQEAKDLRTALHGAASMAKQARQSLGLHDRGTNGEKRDSGKRDRLAMEVEAGIISGEEGDVDRLLN